MTRIRVGSRGTVEVTSTEDVNLDTNPATGADGNAITEADAVAIAAEALQEVRRGPGRPPLPTSERADQIKAVRLTWDQANRLSETAQQRGTSESEVIRQALERFMSA